MPADPLQRDAEVSAERGSVKQECPLSENPANHMKLRCLSGCFRAIFAYLAQERLYSLPDETRVFPGHDYMPDGRKLAYETTIAKSKAENPHLRPETALEEFVSLRTARPKPMACGTSRCR